MARRGRRRQDDDDISTGYSPSASPGYMPVQVPVNRSVQSSMDRVHAVIGSYQRAVSASQFPPSLSPPAQAPYRVGNADLMYPGRIGQKVDPVPVRGSGPFKKLVSEPSRITAQDVARGVSKPSARLDEAGAKALQSRGVDLKGDGGKMCRAVNRPTDTSGDGSSRPFIPWCSKGK